MASWTAEGDCVCEHRLMRINDWYKHQLYTGQDLSHTFGETTSNVNLLSSSSDTGTCKNQSESERITNNSLMAA